MMKSTWVIYSALAVAFLGLLSAILILTSSTLGIALLALTLAGAAALLLFAASQILDELARIHKGMVDFNPEESRDFVEAVESNYSDHKTDMLAENSFEPSQNPQAESASEAFQPSDPFSTAPVIRTTIEPPARTAEP